ncbi:hypothetical protein D1007_30964 [Hordeum vulgare]|nr:hypothetical protein D1007_30964 [Hordeum vulgare]
MRTLAVSPGQIACVISLTAIAGHFRYTGIDSKLCYYLIFFGSFENLIRALNGGSYLVSADLKRSVKSDIAVMQECGLADCNIAYLLIRVPLALTATLEHVQAMVARANGLGVSRDSRMFKHALKAIAFPRNEGDGCRNGLLEEYVQVVRC